MVKYNILVIACSGAGRLFILFILMLTYIFCYYHHSWIMNSVTWISWEPGFKYRKISVHYTALLPFSSNKSLPQGFLFLCVLSIYFCERFFPKFVMELAEFLCLSMLAVLLFVAHESQRSLAKCVLWCCHMTYLHLNLPKTRGKNRKLLWIFLKQSSLYYDLGILCRVT